MLGWREAYPYASDKKGAKPTSETRAIPERLRGVFTTRRYTNSRLPLPYLHKTLRLHKMPWY